MGSRASLNLREGHLYLLLPVLSAKDGFADVRLDQGRNLTYLPSSLEVRIYRTLFLGNSKPCIQNLALHFTDGGKLPDTLGSVILLIVNSAREHCTHELFLEVPEGLSNIHASPFSDPFLHTAVKTHLRQPSHKGRLCFKNTHKHNLLIFHCLQNKVNLLCFGLMASHRSGVSQILVPILTLRLLHALVFSAVTIATHPRSPSQSPH